MKKPPSPLPADTKSFSAYREWRKRTERIDIPEAEWRNDFAENPDGTVGNRITPGFVPQAIMKGDYKHDYSQIRAPVLAFVGFPELPTYRVDGKEISDSAQRIIIEAVFGTYVAMTKNRIKRIESAAGGARVVELWGASHFVFLSNEDEVVREINVFAAAVK